MMIAGYKTARVYSQKWSDRKCSLGKRAEKEASNRLCMQKKYFSRNHHQFTNLYFLTKRNDYFISESTDYVSKMIFSAIHFFWISMINQRKMKFRQKKPHLFISISCYLFVAIIFACYENNFEGDNKLLNKKKKERKGYCWGGGHPRSDGKNKSLCGFHTNSF